MGRRRVLRAAGLQGAGIGEDFLAKLTKKFSDRFLVVRFPGGKERDRSLRRVRANDSELYRCAGFREAWYEGNGMLKDPVWGDSLPVPLASLFSEDAQGFEESLWLLRRP